MVGLLLDAESRDIGNENSSAGRGGNVDLVGPRAEARNYTAAAQAFDHAFRKRGRDDKDGVTFGDAGNDGRGRIGLDLKGIEVVLSEEIPFVLGHWRKFGVQTHHAEILQMTPVRHGLASCCQLCLDCWFAVGCDVLRANTFRRLLFLLNRLRALWGCAMISATRSILSPVFACQSLCAIMPLLPGDSLVQPPGCF